MAHNYNTTTHKMQRLPHSACTHRQGRTLTHTHTCSHTQTHTHTQRDVHTRAHTCPHTCIHTTTSPPAQVAVNDHHDCKFYNCAVGDLKNTTSASYRGSRPHTHQTAQGQVLVCALCAAAIGCCILDLTLCNLCWWCFFQS